jgi:WD40-like Beta Propeller Repeat
MTRINLTHPPAHQESLKMQQKTAKPKMRSSSCRWMITQFANTLARAATFALVFAIAAASTAAALPPDIHWEVIETPHFRIIFDSKQYELALSYAQGAEESFAALTPVFREWPEKTAIVLDDSTDMANGSATNLPYPLIFAYPVLPTATDSVSDYGNWGRELITHEYTHILNFEPVGGIMRPLSWVFGSIIHPNILLPRWYAEGLAVDLETRFSKHGRLRSANFTSIVRAMSDEQTLHQEDIARINEVSIPDWPGGIRPYLFGALVIDEMIRQKGLGIVGELNQAYGRRVPYFINGPVDDRLGAGYAEILQQAYSRAENVINRQLFTIHSQTVQEESALEQTGFFNHSPTVSPDGRKLAYIGREHNIDSLIFVYDRKGDKVFAPSPSLATGIMINRVSWSPDSKRLVHDGIEVFDRTHQYSDLWMLDVEAKKDRQLTHGLRAHEPTFSADGKFIFYTQITPGSTQLAAVKIEADDKTSAPVVLYNPPLQTRISRPEFVKENEIVFSEKINSGEETLKLLRLKKTDDGNWAPSGSPQTILGTFKPAQFPRMSKEGLLFVSEKSGVSNLYLADTNFKTARAVTNTTTRIMTGEIDSLTGDLLYSKLMAKGPQVFRSPKQSWQKVSANAPQVEPLIDEPWPDFQTPVVTTQTERLDYSPWPYLVPRYWMPYVYFAPGVTYLSASTSSQDPTGRHSYGLQLAYETMTTSPSIFGTYTNATTRLPITITALNSYDYLYSLGVQRQFSEAAIDVGFFVPGLSNKWAGTLGWDSSALQATGTSTQRHGPAAQFGYNNSKQKGLEISPERGGTFSVSHRHFLPSISTYEYDVTDLHLAKYFSAKSLTGGLLPERHVLALFSYGSYAPRLRDSVFGVSSMSTNYMTLPGVRGVVMRGYNSGTFIGKNVISGTAEYRFPLSYSHSGFGTKPLFLQRWHAGIFVDCLTLDGFAYNYSSQAYASAKAGEFFYGTGAELKLDTTIGYALPVQFIFGLYYGTNRDSNPLGLFPMLSLGL